MLNTIHPHANIQLPLIHLLIDFPATTSLPSATTQMVPQMASFPHPVQLLAYNVGPTPVTSQISPRLLPPMMRASLVPQQSLPHLSLMVTPVMPSLPVLDDDHHESLGELLPTTAKKQWKPRKKRQCPECKLYFSNLATHKLTHLKPALRPHICKYCLRGFARPNDLFRHIKCHWKEIGLDKGQFKCPFKKCQGDHGDDHCCHNTGIFSRCDTFKNHLKAIHFQYPTGTKKDQRNKVSGKCRMCQAQFRNVDEWMSEHVEKNECPLAIHPIKREP